MSERISQAQRVGTELWVYGESGNGIRMKTKKMLGFCPECGHWLRYPKRRRQNTAYVDDSQNYVVCCAKCFEAIQEHWADMWADYYSDCL